MTEQEARYYFDVNVQGYRPGHGSFVDRKPGHMNFTFRSSVADAAGHRLEAIGANVDEAVGASVLSKAKRGFGTTDEGIITFEDDLRYHPGASVVVRDDGSIVASTKEKVQLTRSLEITREQYYSALTQTAQMADLELSYDYGLYGSTYFDPELGVATYSEAQHCACFVNDIYNALGFPGEIGDIFKPTDRFFVPGEVWHYIPGYNFYWDPFASNIPTGPIHGHVVGTIDPPECFLATTLISMADGSKKPIEDIRVGDLVASYDDNGKLVAGRVTRTMNNTVKFILDVHGLMATPGHVTLCGDGRFENQHVPIIDILRSDGALVKEDGTKVRASTNCELGTSGDHLVRAIAGEKLPDGKFKVTDRGWIRLGTKHITEDGYEISVLELVEAVGGVVTDDGLIMSESGGAGAPFWWHFGPRLPRPEDYVLQRSQLRLNDIYAANEWEAVGPQFPPPQNELATVSNDPLLRT